MNTTLKTEQELSTETTPALGSASPRRRFLSSITGAAVGAALAASALPAEATVGSGNGAHTGTTISGVYDVSDPAFGAVGNGITDDFTAIQSAINAAGMNIVDGKGNSEQGGGVVWFPAGNYLISSPLVVPQEVVLLGSGWGTPYMHSGGSMIVVNNNSNMLSNPAISITGRGTVVRDLAIYHLQPSVGADGTSWTPASFPPAISITADDVRLENLLLVNPTVGISAVNCGRVTMNRIFGQPMMTGIYLDNNQDVIKIDNVHFWQFWNSDLDSPVNAWTLANATAISCYRSDNPQFSNIFINIYNIAFHFGASSAGVTSAMKITNADAGFCNYGIFVDGSWLTGQVTNMTSGGGPGLMVSGANDVKLQFSNIRVSGSPTSCVFVQGNPTAETSGASQNLVTINGLWCEDWNQNGKGASAIEAHELSTINVGPGTIFMKQNYRVGNTSPVTSWSFVGGGGTLNLDKAQTYNANQSILSGNPSQTMVAGQYLLSPDGHAKLTLQAGGNLVLSVASTGAVKWSSGTSVAGDVVAMQGDGNLVIYSSAAANSHSLWASNTGGNPNAYLALLNTGNLVIYSKTQQVLWQTNTAF